MDNTFNELLEGYDEFNGMTLDYATDVHDFAIENQLRNNVDFD